MLELGKPAEWAAEQRVKRAVGGLRHYAKAAGAVVLGLIVMGGITYLLSDPLWMVIGCVVVLAILAFFVPKDIVAGADLMKRSSQAKIGVISEKETRAALRRGKPHVIAYGLKPDKKGGDIDVSVITRRGVILAIEVKTGFGKVSPSGNSLRAGRRVIPHDPLSQAERNADKLARTLALSAEDVIPVVCIPGMTNGGFWLDRRILVCSPKDVISLGDSGGSPVFSNREAAEEALKAVHRKST